jgi:hypothetical protein
VGRTQVDQKRTGDQRQGGNAARFTRRHAVTVSICPAKIFGSVWNYRSWPISIYSAGRCSDTCLPRSRPHLSVQDVSPAESGELALRHQLAVLRRSAPKRLELTVADSVFWVGIKHYLSARRAPWQRAKCRSLPKVPVQHRGDLAEKDRPRPWRILVERVG